jgi:hypothetical protein
MAKGGRQAGIVAGAPGGLTFPGHLLVLKGQEQAWDLTARLPEGAGFFGREVTDATDLEALADRLERADGSGP